MTTLKSQKGRGFSLGQTGVLLKLKMWYEHEKDAFARFLRVSIAVLFERSGIKGSKRLKL